MACVQIRKYSLSAMDGIGIHYDEEVRGNVNFHSNKDIDTSKSYLNYNLGPYKKWKDMAEAMKEEIAKVDREIPPKRIRKDRKTWLIAEVHCPKEIEEMGKEDDFFQKAYEVLKKVFEDHVIGAQVHKDEVHEYRQKKDGSIEKRESRMHMDLFIVPVTKIGINMKTFLDRKRIIAANKVMQEMTSKEYGISYHTGVGKNKDTVETLKERSKMIGEVEKAKTELGSLKAMVSKEQKKLSEIKEQCDDYKAQYQKLRADVVKVNKKKKQMEKALHCMEIQFPQAFVEFCRLLNSFDKEDYEKRKLFLIRGEEIIDQGKKYAEHLNNVIPQTEEIVETEVTSLLDANKDLEELLEQTEVELE